MTENTFAPRFRVRGRRRIPRLPAASDETLALLGTAAPVMAMALVNMCMSVTDTLMAAYLGPEALAAAGVGSDLYSITFYLAIGVMGGLAPLYAAAHASNEPGRLDRLRASGWALAALVGLPAAAFLWTAPGWLGQIGIDAVLLDRGTGYTRAMAVTLLPMLAAGVLRTRLVAVERAGALFQVTLLAVPLNALLNWVFMFGIAGWDGLGVTGAGISSCLVACFTLAVFARLGARCGDHGAATRPDRGTIVEIARLGLPIGIATLSEVGVFLGATLYVATLSVIDAAAHVLAIRVAGVTYAVSIGLLQAATVRMARAEPGTSRQGEIARSAMKLSATAGVAIAVVVALAASPLSRTMTHAAGGAEAAGIAVFLLLLVAVSELFGPPGAAASGLLRGLRITRMPMMFSLIGNWLVAVPVGVWLSAGAGHGAIGVWIGLTLGAATTSCLIGIHLWRNIRQVLSKGTSTC